MLCKKSLVINFLYLCSFTAIPPSAQRTFEDLDDTTGFIYGLKSVESGYLRQVTPSLNDPEHPDMPALSVAIKYLTQTEVNNQTCNMV